MDPKKAKILLIQKGLTIAEISREIVKDSDATYRSVETMVRETLYGIRYYPSIAQKLAEKFDIQIERASNLKTVREQLKSKVA